MLYRIVEKGSSLPGGWLTVVVLGAVLIAAVAIAVHVARRTIRTRAVGDHPLFDDGQLTSAQHRRIAESFAANNDWTPAIRHRLRAVARGLEESGLLDPAPGRTASELAVNAADRLPDLTDEFARAVETFNDVTYGEQPGTQGAYQLIADLDAHLGFGSATQLAPGSWIPAR